MFRPHFTTLMHPIRTVIIFAFCLISLSVFSQSSRYYVNSGELLEMGNTSHEQGNYKTAIERFLQIPESDTNYFRAMYDLSASAMADSQFNLAKEAIHNGLDRLPNPYEHDLLLQMGNVYDMTEKYDSAAYYINLCHQRFPNSYYPIHYKGINFYRKKMYDSAFKCFQQVVLTNPYAYNSHYFLGLLAMKLGYPIQAMLAYSTSLLISPDGGRSKSSVRAIYEIANLTDTTLAKMDDRSEYAFLGEDYGEIESLLKSKIAFDSKYKTKSKVQDHIFNQLNMICEKLPADKKLTGHFYQDYYGTMFKDVFDEDLFNGACMIMISGLEDKSLKRLYQENMKDVQKTSTHVANRLNEIGYQRSLVTPVDYSQPGYFLHNNMIVAKGRFEDKDQKIKTGEFTYYNAMGSITGYRRFEKDKYQGEMKLYYWNGKLSYEGLFEKDVVKGKSNSYYLSGAPERLAEMDGDIRKNEFVLFYPNGNKKEEDHYKDGKYNGITRIYYEDGGLQYEANQVNNKIEGTLKEFFHNGKLYSTSEFKNGELNGDLVIYFQDGSIYEKGSCKDNEREGLFTSYFQNGKVSAKEMYKKGKLHGNCIYYFENGVERLNLTYDEGEKEGTSTERNDANVVVEVDEYKKGHIKKLTYYNVLTGRPIKSNEIESKSQNTIKVYNEIGVLLKQAVCNQDGIYNGEYKEFYPDGVVSVEENYVNKKLEGPGKTYYPSGKLKSECTYENNELNDLYKEYYENGTLSKEGMLDKGLKQGYWYEYDELGRMTSKSYYLDNERDGVNYDYLPSGKVLTKTYFDRGYEYRLVEFDTMGHKVQDLTMEPGKEYKVDIHDLMGKKKREIIIRNNYLIGDEKQYYPDGKLSSSLHRRNSEEDSVFQSYYHDGTLRKEGWFANGNRTGRWVSYDRFGEIDYVENYRNGTLHGVDTFFSCVHTIETIAPKYNGEKHGWTEKYAPNGDLLYKYHYIHDQLVGYTYLLPDGNFAKEIPVENSGKKETLKTFYKNGKPSSELEYRNGEFNGKRTLYYPDGKIWLQATYSHGDIDGEEKEFYPNGQLYSSKTMKQGEAYGSLNVYTSTGKPIAEENYVDGYIHGVSKYYKKDGSLESTITYYWGSIVSVK